MRRKNGAKEGDNFRPKQPQARLFSSMLLRWDEEENDRRMPWKGVKDPYRIWLSEIILQQTRVEQGLKYYENFTREFPTLAHLATAREAQVFKLWEGLGYYSRCRNLVATAKNIHENAGGNFPADYDSLLQLKGVGPYTAAAIASFAYNLPHAVLDGNVFRVLSRVFDLDTPVDAPAGKKEFARLAQYLLPPEQPGRYNQAIMDFGATVCKPVPECARCFFNSHCLAYRNGRQDLLPIKEKQVRIRERWMYYFVLWFRDSVAIRQRTGKDIWQSLYEFPLIESGKVLNRNEQLEHFQKQFGPVEMNPGASWQTRQRLTHQQLNLYFLQIHGKKKYTLPGFIWIPVQELDAYAFPRSLQQYIQETLK